MHILAAFLYVCLMAAPECASIPIKKNTEDIVNIAKTTLVHIKKLRTELPVSPPMDNTPPIGGLTGISHDLGLLDNELRSLQTDFLSQIQADVSSLKGRVLSLGSTLNCPVQVQAQQRAPETGMHLYPESHLYLMLGKVQSYLDKLLLHKEKLKVC
ncbi:leptin-B-like [Mugil cephalus]|uniref:leptin-B-like n=1 Tax=Mugil cephalus TaxID=48193 RepID=UPI001FB75375|nr:leptin-B-like [Mugil cephalus]XP_047431832.1 leptin-B-like [Mugil cephalus]